MTEYYTGLANYIRAHCYRHSNLQSVAAHATRAPAFSRAIRQRAVQEVEHQIQLQACMGSVRPGYHVSTTSLTQACIHMLYM